MHATLQEVAFFLLLPILILLLMGAWMLYASRGRRAVSFNLQGFGISLRIDSAERDDSSSTRGQGGS